MEKNGFLSEGIMQYIGHGIGLFGWDFHGCFEYFLVAEFNQRLGRCNAVLQQYCDWVDNYFFGRIEFCVSSDDQ